MSILRTALAIALLAIHVTLAAQSSAPTRVCFVDEAVRDPTLVQFRNTLMAAIRARDLVRLRPLIAENVEVEKEVFGKNRLEQLQNLADPESESWRSHEKLLQLGGRFDGKAFCAPYTSCPWPPMWGGSGDVVVLGTDVPAYEAPSDAATVVKRLSCDVLRIEGAPRAPLFWMAVPVGRTWAYVRYENVRFVDDDYVYMEKRAGKWLVTKY